MYNLSIISTPFFTFAVVKTVKTNQSLCFPFFLFHPTQMFGWIRYSCSWKAYLPFCWKGVPMSLDRKRRVPNLCTCEALMLAIDLNLNLTDMSAGLQITGWPAHDSAISSILFGPDETSIFSLGSDGKASIFIFHIFFFIFYKFGSMFFNLYKFWVFPFYFCMETW